MKTILLKTGLVNGVETSTRELIKLCLNTVPSSNGVQTGFSFDDLKQRMRIQQAMDKSKSTVLADGAGDLEESFELEDADYSNFLRIVAQSRWVVRDKFVYDFLDEYSK
jgi:hypothetical protein